MGSGTCMGPTGVVVHALVLHGWWYVHVSYNGVGVCMGLTGVVVRACVLHGCWCVDGSYRGGGTCMGLVVRAWVLQGW